MRKLIHKRPHGQQSIDLFFKPNNVKFIPQEAEKTNESKPEVPIIQNSVEKTKYTPIISYSDFEFDFSSDDEDKQQFDSKNNNARANKSNKKFIEDQVIDNDSDFKKDDEDEDETYSSDESLVSSPIIVTRHKELEKKKEKVNIFTPSWKYTSPTDKSENSIYSNFRYDLNSMCNIHYQLEVIEKRIQNGDDEEHDHPAMCVQVLDEEGISKVTSEERKLRDDYEEIKYDKIKPSFWEPRCYDDEYCQLTKNDNKLLLNLINLANDTDSNEIVTWKPEDELIPPENDYSFKKSDKKRNEKIENRENCNEDDSLLPSRKFVFVNSAQCQVPSISFTYDGSSFNKAVNAVKKESREKFTKKKDENHSAMLTKAKNEKHQKEITSNRNGQKKTISSFVKKMNCQSKEDYNPFDSETTSVSDFDSETTTSTFSTSDSSCKSMPDTEDDTSSATNSNDENVIFNNNENEQIIKKSDLNDNKPKVSKQRVLKLWSLLFDTDSDESETDFENF